VPLDVRIEDGFMRERVHPGGKPFDVVTRVDGAAFSEFWLRTVTREECVR
jgi:hypothetical protein